jgi:hypothetical protein
MFLPEIDANEEMICTQNDANEEMFRAESDANGETSDLLTPIP